MQVINHTYEFNEFLNSKKYEKHMKKDIPESIIIDEIPYQVNKSKLIERIAETVRATSRADKTKTANAAHRMALRTDCARQ
jgi:DNA gyrase/topoisomerase IV subunit A